MLRNANVGEAAARLGCTSGGGVALVTARGRPSA
jgi:hypothetical protein